MTNRRSLLRGLAVMPALAAPAAIATTAPQPALDVELLALEAELHALDADIDRMAHVTGDRDIDEHPGYEEAEDRRFAVLAAIAVLRARTQAGIVAKARILKSRRVVEDYISTGEISASMADDVLRLLGEVV